MQLEDLAIEYKREYTNKYSLQEFAALELCNQFRKTLKPVFKLFPVNADEIVTEI